MTITTKSVRATLGMAVCAAALSWGANAADIPERHFKGVASFSSSPIHTTRAVPFWKEQIKEASGGKITADVLASDELGLKGSEVYRVAKNGLWDFLTYTVSYAVGDDTRLEVLDLAGFVSDTNEHKKIADAYRPVLEKIMADKFDLRMMAIWPVGTTVVWCNGEIGGLADLKGKKVRGFNKTMSDFLTGIGATPVSMSLGEVVTALQRKTVDCAITSPRTGLKAGWAEVATHMLPIALGWATTADNFANGSWNKLDQATKDLLTNEYKKFESDIYEKVKAETEDAYRCLAGKKPCNSPGPIREPLTIVQPSDADIALYRKIAETVVLPAWAKRCGADCVAEWNGTVGKVTGITLNP